MDFQTEATGVGVPSLLALGISVWLDFTAKEPGNPTCWRSAAVVFLSRRDRRR